MNAILPRITRSYEVRPIGDGTGAITGHGVYEMTEGDPIGRRLFAVYVHAEAERLAYLLGCATPEQQYEALQAGLGTYRSAAE